jgi:inosose dehydratase
MLNRRDVLASIGGAATAWAFGGRELTTLAAAAEDRGALSIATNTYPWGTFAHRDHQPIKLHAAELLLQIASTGITGYEPIIETPAEVEGLARRLQQHSLGMQSIYVNSVLHDPAQSEASISHVLSIAEAVKPLGVIILVTNPSPIRWGGPEDKTDTQLLHQAKSLNQLGEALSALGVTLAYHNHDAELRQGGREFHHMLSGTNPKFVKFCFDAHWVYRGCGNSAVAVFDVLKQYGSRIVELHLRQSKDGVWQEVFTADGDIDYVSIWRDLLSQSIQPHLVLEQAVEAASPNTLDVVAAHRTGFQNASKAFNH